MAFIIAFFCLAIAATAQQIPKLKMADVVKLFDNKSDTVYIVNFWATFCKPCVAEIPNFIKIAEQYKKQKVKLLLVSLDLPSFYPKRIAAFATKYNFATNLGWLDETDADYFCPMIDKSWSGAIPATIMVNAKTGYKKFFEGEIKGEEFEKELRKALNLPNSSVTSAKFLMPMEDVVSVKYFDSKSTACLPSFATTFKSKDSCILSLNDGEVSNVIDIEDMKVVILQKGKEFYIYSNLKTAFVKKGDKVETNQTIGYATGDLDGVMPTLEFYMSDEYGPVILSKNNFKPRRNQSIYFTPMLGIEPE
jgi:thiol-disulfide isomerase/thioredoxin